MTSNCHASSPFRRAFTIVELLLSLILTSVVVAVISIMLFALSESTVGEHEARAQVHRRDIASERTSALLRQCRASLAHDASRHVLWMHDDDGDGAPRISELAMLDWDQSSGEVRCYRTQGPLAAELDTIFALDTDFMQEAAQLAGTSRFPGAAFLRDVAEWEVAPDAPITGGADRMTVRARFRGEPPDERVIIVAVMRQSAWSSAAD